MVTSASWARARRARGSRRGGLEPGPTASRGPRLKAWVPRYLRVLYTRCDRSCPPRTSDSRCRADPVRTRAIRVATSTSSQGREEDVAHGRTGLIEANWLLEAVGGWSRVVVPYVPQYSRLPAYLDLEKMGVDLGDDESVTGLGCEL
jgi:hypothetical protein